MLGWADVRAPGSLRVRRELWPSYLLVAGGLLAGLLVAGVMSSTEPALLRWILSAGIGLTGGAFVAAIVSGVAIGNSGGLGARRRRGKKSVSNRDPLAYLEKELSVDENPVHSQHQQPEGIARGGPGSPGNGRAL